MMCFKVIFQIVISLFCVFGIYSLVLLTRVAWRERNDIFTCVHIKSKEAVEALSTYLEDAKCVSRIVGGKVCFLVDRVLVTEELIEKIKHFHISVFIVDMENIAE